MTPAVAQQQEDASRRLRAIEGIVIQRNNAMDSAAICYGDTQELNKQIEALKRELEEAKKTCDRK